MKNSYLNMYAAHHSYWPVVWDSTCHHK